MKRSFSLLAAIILLCCAVLMLGGCDELFGETGGGQGNVGDKEEIPEYLIFESNGDGTCVVSGVNDKNITDLKISRYSFDGDMVVGITDKAFKDCKSLEKVVIHDGISKIGYSAFVGCEKLADITLPFVGVRKVTANNTNFGYIFGGNTDVPASLKTVTITGQSNIEDFAFDDCISITQVTFSGGVTSIGKNAFKNCTSLESLVLPDTLTEISEGMLNGCTSLKGITIPNSVTCIGKGAFEGCEGITSITVPNNVGTIGMEAFKDCNNLTSISLPFIGASKTEYTTPRDASFEYIFGYESDIPESLKEVTITGKCNILSYAFESCKHLTSITLTDVNIGILDSAFRGCDNLESLIIPEGVTVIGDSAFDDCVNLTSIIIPDGVTEIGDRAFYYCKNLKSITIPSSVTRIGEYAFSRCESLESIIIADGVKTIEENAFSSCQNIKSVTIGSNVDVSPLAFNYCDPALYTECEGGKYIGDESNPYAVLMALTDQNLSTYKIHDNTKSLAYGVFNDCTGLTSISVSEQSKHYKTIDGNLYSKDGKTLIKYAIGKDDSSFTIPDTVDYINDYAFYKCQSLTNVTIPDSVTTIGNSAFSSCKSLISVTIGKDVTILDNAFSYCNSALYTEYGSCKYVGNENNPYAVLAELSTQNAWTYQIHKDTKLIAYGVFDSCIGHTNISVDEQNLYYKSIDGNLYSKDGKTLIKYNIKISTDSFSIPAGVTHIDDYAFYSCQRLTSVTIPDSVTTIGENAFKGCTDLTSVTFGSNITAIGKNAFLYCTSITDVYYVASENNWQMINIDPHGNYYMTALGVNIHFNHTSKNN